MAKSKKGWKRKNKQEIRDVQNDMIESNKLKNEKIKAENIKSEDLFTLTDSKDTKVRANREALKADRFRQYRVPKSFNENVKVKKMLRSGNTKVYKPDFSKPLNEEPEVDLWGSSAPVVPSNRHDEKARKFLKSTRVVVKRIVKPMGGQSYNPSMKDHADVIKQVVEEEIEEIKEDQRIDRFLNPEAYDDEEEIEEASEKSEEESEESEEEKDENGKLVLGINPAVDRDDIVKPSKMVKRKLHRVKQNVSKAHRKQVAAVVKKASLTTKKRLRELALKKEKLEIIKEIELKSRKEEGIVLRPQRVGRFKYNMRKTDFVEAEELQDSLRRAKPLNSLIHDQLDSYFRRGIMENKAPAGLMKKVEVAKYR